MSSLFVNLNAPDGPLPGVFTIPRPDGPYFGRVIHAELDHHTPPFARKPPAFRHPHYHIVLVTSGQGEFDIDGELCPVHPGSIFFTTPRQSHQFLNAGEDNARYAEVTFELVHPDGRTLDLEFHDLLFAWTKQPCNPLTSRLLPPAFVNVLASQIGTLVDRGRATPRPDDLELGMLLMEILTTVFRGLFKQQTIPPDKIDRVRDIIRAGYRAELRLTTLAKESGLSPAHLSRRFKARFGRSPIDYQLDLRLRSACALMRTGDDPLAVIAAAVGFDDVYYFSRLFRRRLGEPPGAFRQRLRAGVKPRSKARQSKS